MPALRVCHSRVFTAKRLRGDKPAGFLYTRISGRISGWSSSCVRGLFVLLGATGARLIPNTKEIAQLWL